MQLMAHLAVHDNETKPMTAVFLRNHIGDACFPIYSKGLSSSELIY